MTKRSELRHEKLLLKVSEKYAKECTGSIGEFFKAQAKRVRARIRKLEAPKKVAKKKVTKKKKKA